MKMASPLYQFVERTYQSTEQLKTAALFAVAAIVVGSASAQNPYSNYIPSAVPTATTQLVSGTTTIAPGRVAVDRLLNTFYIGHTSAGATLYEIPAASPVVTNASPAALITGLGGTNANGVFVDAAGTLWVSNGSGTNGALIEIPPSSNGIPNVAALTGVAATSITAACSSTSTSPCIWSGSSIGVAGLQVSDIYSDGAGNVYLVDVKDSTSAGAYNRVIQFNNASAGMPTVLADKLTSNAYAQITVAGDGNVYYCDSVTGNASGGNVSLISGGALTTVANTATSSLTLLNGGVKITAATGVTTDPWGDLVISGVKQLSEIPLETGALNFLDEFGLLIAVSGANSPVATNNIIYGGSIDVHGNYYYASATNVGLIEVGGHNFGSVNVGTEVTAAAPFIDITWDIPSYLIASGVFPTASPSSLSAANAGYLQSFPNGNNKNFFGGTPYSAANTGQYLLMYFQAVHPGLLRGSDAPAGYTNYYAATDITMPGGASYATTDFAGNGAYVVNLQGVGQGPLSMFLPGTATRPMTLSSLYTTVAHSTKVVGFTPSSVALDSYGNLYVTDTANTNLDLGCLATSSNTMVAGSGYCQANGAGYNYEVGYSNSTTTSGVTYTRKFTTNFVNPADATLDGANNVYVLDSGAGTAAVTLMPYDTMIPRIVIPNATMIGTSTLRGPMGITIDGYANLYIADTGNNRIIQAHLDNSQYSKNIVYISSSVKFGGIPLSTPQGLGVDSAGDLFIADTGNGRIVEYSVTGVTSVITTTGVSLSSPTSVKVLPSGALVVADNKVGLVLISNGAAQTLSTGAYTLASTGGLSLDLAGNIYVADPVGQQIIEVNISSPGSATFPATLKPDASGSHTSKETSYIYNAGNTPLTLTTTPTVVDNSSSATNEFAIDGNNLCTGSLVLASNANCTLIADFTPSSAAAVYTTVTGTVSIPDSVAAYTLVASPASSAQDIGNFGATGSTQQLILSGAPIVPFTPQAITFTAPAPVTFSTSIPPIQLVATGGATGNPVTFSIVSGTGSLSGANNSILTVSNIGTTVIAANQAGGLVGGVYYSAAPQVTASIVVNPIGVIATPTFSVAAGTYTAVQSVTIADASAGATIYYTTNGNNPTTSSPVYTGGAIPVTITTTIKAIAVGALGYSPSPVAVATYVLNPDFILKTYVTSFTIPNGLGGSTALEITPLFGFSGTINLACSGLSQKDACSFLNAAGNPTTTLTTIGGATAYGTMVIQASETSSSAALQPTQRPFVPVTTVALAACMFCFRKRRRVATILLVLLSIAGATMMTACSSPSYTGGSHSSTFTFTATSGTVVHTQTITLVVDNL